MSVADPGRVLWETYREHRARLLGGEWGVEWELLPAQAREAWNTLATELIGDR